MLATWQDGEERDVHQDMTRLTMEIVAKVLFGEEITSDAEQACDALSARFFKQYDERFGLYLIPEWLPTPENLRYRRAIKRLDEIVLRIIRDKVARTAMATRRMCFPSCCARAKAKSAGMKSARCATR
jgi:cytochrome P450